MAFNNYYKKKRREEKSQQFAESILNFQKKYQDKLRADAATLMIVGAHHAYRLLYNKYIKKFEEAEYMDDKYSILVALATEISDKHTSTMAETKAYCEKLGVEYHE